MEQESPKMFNNLKVESVFDNGHRAEPRWRFQKINLSFILLFFFLCSSISFAQQQKPTKVKHVNSDKAQRTPKMYNGNLFFTGNVIFQQGASIMKADTVVLYEKENRIVAFPNAYLKKGDQVLTTKYLDYNGDTKLAVAEGEVVLKEADQTLTSNRLVYDMDTNIAIATGEVVLRKTDQTLYTDKLEYNRNTEKVYYNEGGTIVSKDNTINSKVGIFDLRTGENTFDDDVRMINKDYIIEGKGVKHNSKGEFMEFSNQTLIQNRKNPNQYIEASAGSKYFTKREEAFLENRSSVHSDGTVLTADQLYFNQKTGFGKGEGDVVIENKEEKQLIKGGYGEFFQDKDSAFVTQDAYAVRAFEKDSLYLHADTLMSTKRNEKGLIKAYNHAKFFKSNLQGKADSISFSEATGQIEFFRKPVVWSGYRQITGDTIFVYMNTEAERLDSMKVKQNAFAISKTDSITNTQFHQLKSREMLGLFINDNLDWVQAEGNAQTLIYMEDEKKDSTNLKLPPKKELVGINRSDCGIVEADFEEREIQVLSCRINADSEMYPPSKLPEDQRKLPDFIWRQAERPLQWRDIFIIDSKE